MDFLAEGFRRALALIFSVDAEVYGIALLTLKIGLLATLVACGLGIPVGFVLATKPFWGRRAALTVVNTALAFPTVVVGLLLYGLLSRRGVRKSTRLNSSHPSISYAVFCLKIKNFSSTNLAKP